ncbi:MAG: FAD-binding protein [Actinomycetales bacterium]|nr:FAD-binding protein [Actinomycetales bacterium]
MTIPDGFPADVPVERRSVENWSRMIAVHDVLTAIPETEEQALAVVRWAADAGYRVRPIGAFHTWAPILAERAEGIVLVDQSRLTGLVGFDLEPVPCATFRCGTTLAEATRLLESIDNGGRAQAPGWAWPDYPGIPDVTIGGMLAIGAHGAGIRLRADQEDLFGTMSNLILAFRAIVSDGDTYVVRDFRRQDPQAAAFLVHLGNAFLLQVTLRVVPNCFLGRRVEYPDWQEVFAEPSAELPARSMQAMVEEHGRVQQLWFPFTTTPIVQHFTEEPEPAGEAVTEPLTVRLSPDLPAAFSTAFTSTLAHLPWLTPLVERTTLAEMRHLSPPGHAWHGTSGNMLLYVQHDTLRVISLAYAILVRRDEVQSAVHALGHQFGQMLHAYARAGLEPINSCLEFRVTDVDRAEALGVPGATPALLSPARPLPGSNAERVIWFDLVTTPGAPNYLQFYAEFEQWLWSRFDAPGALRAEWSKAWAVSASGPWTNREIIDRVLRSYDPDGSLATVRDLRDAWRSHDAQGVFGSPFISGVFAVDAGGDVLRTHEGPGTAGLG